ncbi:MAG: DEAD/DEAH box helicase [Pseudomonadota bacterium]|nr:DEAD/DEAH box helicase [Pseudomonadota bacterium]
MNRVFLRGQAWLVRDEVRVGSRVLLRLADPETGEQSEVLCPPDHFEPLAEPAPKLLKQALTPFTIWRTYHESLRLAAPPAGEYSALYAGRLSPESYQFAPLARLLSGPRRSLLIADDVGLGKTIEAGICLLELIARGVGKRVLLVVPPGLIPQWLDEMWEKFGLEFQAIENATSLDRAQTLLSEGLQPWAYFDRVITSTEYLKRRDVHAAALAHPWDIVVVDEAHYLAESGTPANPYSTARTRLGPKLREASRALILLTATPHNGYRHSFRSLLELVEPADATLHGRVEDIRRRVGRSMIRRLKPQISKTSACGGTEPAFPVRLPVTRIEVQGLSGAEREIFRRVSGYCAKTLEAAAGSEEADLVSFAMQIVKKRMLSSRAALKQTLANRLDALSSRTPEEPPPRSELRELQADLPHSEAAAERTANRVLRAAVARDARRRSAEKRQLKSVAELLDRLADRPDPKIATLIVDLKRDVLPVHAEKSIIFTEYRDTLAAIREAFKTHATLANAFVELTGGLSATQRKARIAQFHQPGCRVLLATDAASEGLNLQRQCWRLYHFELPWNPNRLEQRNGRIDRHGQTRPPDIRYLFYPDTPEDRVLDRLVQRIVQMHDDRVSTPDILGIIEGSRIEGVLGKLDSLEAGETAAQFLLKQFDARQEEFAYQIAPLLLSAAEGQSSLPLANAVSADPLMQDDAELDRHMREALHGALRPGILPETYRIDVPRHLQGPGVPARYICATFRRSIATRYPANDVEFIHRLHPLFRAIAHYALDELTLAPMRNASGSRIAVCRHPSAAKSPIALFTFLERQTHPLGCVFAITVNHIGQILPQSIADALLPWNRVSPGEVSWPECEKVFSVFFASLQAAAETAARAHLKTLASMQRNERASAANVLREEATLYRVDRLAEIETDERSERAGTREQMQLFRETAINWQARRAAVETHYRRRLEDIERYTQIPEPPEPQALGVLLVFAPA